MLKWKTTTTTTTTTKQAKAKQHLEAELLLFENYSVSSSTIIKNVQKRSTSI